MIYQARSWTEDPSDGLLIFAKSSPTARPAASLRHEADRPTPRIHSKRRRAFTLMEMVVVLVILATIAGAAVFTLQRPLQKARMNRILASLEDADRRARTQARRSSQTIKLTIHDATATQSPVDGTPGLATTRSLPFTGGLRIDRFIGATGSQADAPFPIVIGPNGQSDTYAMRLAHGNASERGKQQSRPTWLIVVGTTGQYIRSNEDSIVETIVLRQK